MKRTYVITVVLHYEDPSWDNGLEQDTLIWWEGKSFLRAVVELFLATSHHRDVTLTYARPVTTGVQDEH